MRPAAALNEAADPLDRRDRGRAALIGPPSVPAEPDRPSRSILIAIVGALVALAVVGSVGWRMAGGSLFTIATPSMCPDLCVGTLVLDQPVHGPVHVGEVVTFRPPGTGTVYTHRVVRVLADGSFKTAGDALGKVDPWTVPPSNVIGRVVFHVRGLGWLWRFLPWMAAALACIVIGRRSIPGRLRKECDLLAITMLAVLPILLMRPLLRASVISWHLRHGGAVVMTVVNDGLLPAQFRVTGGPGASHLAPGQIVTMVGTTQPGGLVTVRQLASFSWWEWALVAFVVLLPMVGLLAGLLWRRVRPPRLGLAPAVAPAAVAAAAAPQWYQPVAGGPGRYAAPMAQAPPWPPPGQPLR